MKDAINEFLLNDELESMKFVKVNTASVRIKAWRIIKKYKEQTGIDPFITISVQKDGVTLTKTGKPEISFIMKDGSRINSSELAQKEII